MLAAVILIKSYKHIYTASQAKSCINLYSQAMIGQVGKSCLRPMKSIASHSESTLGITIFQVFKNNVELFFKVTTFHYFQPEFKFKKKKKNDCMYFNIQNKRTTQICFESLLLAMHKRKVWSLRHQNKKICLTTSVNNCNIQSLMTL